jgi:hypothetical protein
MKSKRGTIAVILLLLIISYSNIYAQADTIINGINIYPKRYYTAIRTINIPKLDGKLDDDCWNTGLWAGDFRQGTPKEGAPTFQPSKFKILYDY